MTADSMLDDTPTWASATGRHKWLWLALGVTGFVSVLFWLFPGLDTAAARAFHTPSTGFVGEQYSGLVALMKLGRASGWVVGAVMLGVVLLRLFRPASLSHQIWRRWWVTLLAMILGPGLLVNGILKAYMGRPRPHQTTLFGGTAEFMPVWTYSTGCKANCSFVAGEASFGFFLIVFAFWFTGRNRLVALAAIGVFGFVMSLNRMAFGAHFLSDVLLAWSLTAVVILLVDRYLPPRLVEM